jgi:hypothetical protein
MGVRNAGLTAIYLSPGVFKLPHVQHELKISAGFRKKVVVVQSLPSEGMKRSAGADASVGACSFELERQLAPPSIQAILAGCNIIRSADAWVELLKTAGYPVPAEIPEKKPAIISFNQVGPELGTGSSKVQPQLPSPAAGRSQVRLGPVQIKVRGSPPDRKAT